MRAGNTRSCLPGSITPDSVPVLGHGEGSSFCQNSGCVPNHRECTQAERGVSFRMLSSFQPGSEETRAESDVTGLGDGIVGHRKNVNAP